MRQNLMLKSETYVTDICFAVSSCVGGRAATGVRVLQVGTRSAVLAWIRQTLISVGGAVISYRR